MSNIKYRAAIVLVLCLLPFDLCAAGLPGPAQKHDKHAPIDITSDTLEVFQAENRAVFSGHVVAIQAEDRLKADQMTVYYRKQNGQQTGQPAAAKPANKPAAPDSGNPLNAGAVRKIDTKGHVFLSTPQDTASGDVGDYDVEKQTIHLNDHVVLTHGKDVLKGDHLVYNLDTGKSVVTSNGVTVGPHPTKSRVHALFIPENKDKNKATNQPKVQPQSQPPSPQPSSTQPNP